MKKYLKGLSRENRRLRAMGAKVKAENLYLHSEFKELLEKLVNELEGERKELVKVKKELALVKTDSRLHHSLSEYALRFLEGDKLKDFQAYSEKQFEKFGAEQIRIAKRVTI